ncbi:MAG: hypothetical protein KVP17_000266 [Porospora cf. gigantea B]|uniref:uncharacterized protein n=1 Tax=Porospora cf. gigantea B TaxID=2853592 RepID=UPI003571B890|nr:MAG: hypothetical protein KVP17_000266 [Porospora cf. gigantea B]
MRADYVVRYSNLTPLVDPAPGPEFPMLASPTAIGVADWPAFSDVDYGAGSGFSSTSSATAEIPLQPYSSMTSDSPKPTMVRRLQTFSRLITRRRPRSEEYQDSSSQSESEIAGHSNRRRILGRTAGMRQLASSVHVGSAGLKPATGTLPSVVSEEATAEVTSTIRSMGLRQAMESGLHAHTYAALFASLLVPVEDQNDQDSELRLAVENSQLEQSSVRSRMSVGAVWEGLGRFSSTHGCGRSWFG